MKFRRFILVIIITANIFMMSSCWDYREINNLAIVSGLAVDKDGETGKYKIAVEIINLESQKGESSIKPEVLHCEGSTIFQTVRGLIKKSGRRLYWSHAKAVIFGESLAREGIAPVLDWITRDAEVRQDMYVLVSKEKTAGEIFDLKPSIEDLVSFEVASTMESEKSTEEFKEENLWHILNDFAEKGMSDVVPIIRKAKLEEKDMPVISGSGVFKKDKLVGWLDGEETKDVIFVRDEIKGGLLTFNNVEGTNNNVVLEILDSKTEVTVDYKNNKAIFNVNIKPRVDIAEINGEKDFVNEKNRKKLKEYCNENLEKRVKETVEKVQNDYGSDIFKFGNLIERKMPGTWKKINDDWEQEFKSAEVNVKVDMNIAGSATTVEPIKIEE